jgi:putative intracellular protease/amidase
VDGNLVTGKHPAVNDLFMETFVREIESARR